MPRRQYPKVRRKGADLIGCCRDSPEYYVGNQRVHGKEDFLSRILAQGHGFKGCGHLIFDPTETVSSDAGLPVNTQCSGRIGESRWQANRVQ